MIFLILHFYVGNNAFIGEFYNNTAYIVVS